MYANDLKNVSHLSDLIIIADDTNLFLTSEDISYPLKQRIFH